MTNLRYAANRVNEEEKDNGMKMNVKMKTMVVSVNTVTI